MSYMLRGVVRLVLPIVRRIEVAFLRLAAERRAIRDAIVALGRELKLVAS